MATDLHFLTQTMQIYSKIAASHIDSPSSKIQTLIQHPVSPLIDDISRRRLNFRSLIYLHGVSIAVQVGNVLLN
jgi:hypothetical protein